MSNPHEFTGLAGFDEWKTRTPDDDPDGQAYQLRQTQEETYERDCNDLLNAIKEFAEKYGFGSAMRRFAEACDDQRNLFRG
jgi:hypothetical protein